MAMTDKITMTKQQYLTALDLVRRACNKEQGMDQVLAKVQEMSLHAPDHNDADRAAGLLVVLTDIMGA